jgi:molecular chaperone GrpE (heat shock protein)
MESEIYGVAVAEALPESQPELTESFESTEKTAQAKTRKTKAGASQARVSQLLESLSEIDAKRLKLEADRDEIKKQLAAAVANL